MLLPYGLIVIIAVIFLTFHYVVISDASDRSKWIVGGLAVISLVAPWRFPRWDIPATILQVGICIYVLLFRKVNSGNRKQPDSRTSG